MDLVRVRIDWREDWCSFQRILIDVLIRLM